MGSHITFCGFILILQLVSTLAEPNPNPVGTGSKINSPDISNDDDFDDIGEDPNDIVTVLIHTVLIPINDTEKNSSGGIPDVEFKKLKAATKGAGLSDSKADRVVRAARALDLHYNEVVDLKKVMMNPATSADYAERVRRSLEDAVVEKHHKESLQNNYDIDGQGSQQNDDAINFHVARKSHPGGSGQGQGQYKTNKAWMADSSLSDPFSKRNVDNINYVSGSDQRQFDAAAINKIKSTTILSGSDHNTASRLVRALIDYGLNSQQIHNVGDVISSHGARSQDLDKFIDHLEETTAYRRSIMESENDGNTDDFVSTPDKAEGADWIYER